MTNMTRRSFLGLVTLLTGLSPARGEFRIYEQESLDVSLGNDCVGALSSSIACQDYVQQFVQLKYRTSLQDDALTDSICTADCRASLESWFVSVSKSCAGKTLQGAIPTKFGGYMWAGFNETCVTDPKTGKYCNGMYMDREHETGAFLKKKKKTED